MFSWKIYLLKKFFYWWMLKCIKVFNTIQQWLGMEKKRCVVYYYHCTSIQAYLFVWQPTLRTTKLKFGMQHQQHVLLYVREFHAWCLFTSCLSGLLLHEHIIHRLILSNSMILQTRQYILSYNPAHVHVMFIFWSSAQEDKDTEQTEWTSSEISHFTWNISIVIIEYINYLNL